jgi:predicted RNA binding protein YcfA (HicA-like mRNA interferase family)
VPRLPRLRPDRVARALRKAGFVDYRQRGSHLTMLHPDTGRNVTVPMHGQVLSVGLTHSILKQAGLSVGEFLKLLK